MPRPPPPGDLFARLAARSGVTRLADLTGLDVLGLPVMAAIRPAARSLSLAAGKGATREAAMASAVMEAFEHHAAETAELPLLTHSSAEIAGDPAFADPALLPRDRRARPSPGAPIRWARAERLDGGGALHVPWDMVHLRLTPAAMATSGGFLTSTNGLAAGLDREAALLHGLCEVVERDAISLALAGPRAPGLGGLPRLDPSGAPALDALLARCAGAGLAAAFWDLTCDTGVAVVWCRLSETPLARRRLARPCDGAGCSPDPAEAALRALTEAAQSRLTLIAGARDDIDRRDYAGGPAPPERPAERRLADLPAAAGDPLCWTLARLAAAGFPDAAAIELAGGEATALRVIVPGLEGTSLSPGYVPGPRARARR